MCGKRTQPHKQREDDPTLSYYNIQRGSTLHLRPSDEILILIKTLTGKTFTFGAEPSDNIDMKLRSTYLTK